MSSKHRVAGHDCCDESLRYLLFDFGANRWLFDGGNLRLIEICYCPFCGEEL